MPVNVGRHTKTGSWTVAEDDLLAEWQSKVGNKWAEVARRIPGRTGQQCAQRWRHKVNPNIRKEKWSDAEDENLTRLYYVYGNAWAEISRNMNGRTDQQCMGRWRRHLDPAIRRDPWRDREDAALAALYSQYGNQWSVIAKQIPGRTAQQCRVRWYQAESGHGQHLQECQRFKEDVRTPRRKTKQQAKKHDSDDEWEGDANSESDGTDFEAEYLVKARARRQCSSRRLPSVAEIMEELKDHASSEEEENEERLPRNGRLGQLTADPSGSARRVSSIRKGTSKLGLSGSQSSRCLAEEESEGCETVLKKRQGKSSSTCRYRDTRDGDSAGMDHDNTAQRLQAALNSEMTQAPTSNSGLGNTFQPYSLQTSSPCQEVQSGEGNERARRSKRWTSGRNNLLKTDSGADNIESQESLAAEADTGLPFCNQIRQDSSVGMSMQGSGIRHLDSQVVASENLEACHEFDSDSPPLLSQQTQMPSDSHLLTSSHFQLTSPDRSLLSPNARCLAEITPQQPSRNLGRCLSSQTPLTGSKRNTPGGGFVDRSREAWEISPTEHVLNLFQSPNQCRGRSNPLQSPSFQNLATPEWARGDYCSPTVPSSRSRRAGTPGHRQEDLPTAGKPLNRGTVARRLDVEAAQGGRAFQQSTYAHHDSPAKKLRSNQKENPQAASSPAQAVPQQEEKDVGVMEKENSACNALKQLSMAAFALEHSREETSSADTHWLSPACQPAEKPATGSAKTPGDRLPISKSKPSPRAKIALESSEAVRMRLHALLDDL